MSGCGVCGEPVKYKQLCGYHYHKQYAEAHKEKFRAAARRYNAKYPDKRKTMNEAWKANNKPRIYDAHVKRRTKNYTETLAAESAYREANRDRVRATQNAWYGRNRDKALVISAKKRARRAGAEGSHTAKQIAELRVKQRCRCAACKTSLRKGEHKDHIIPLILGGSNYIENIQLLCPLCNLQKHGRHPIEFMQSKGMLL